MSTGFSTTSSFCGSVNATSSTLTAPSLIFRLASLFEGQKPSFTMPFNVAGYPAISVCSGFGEGGLPVAIQLVGKPFQEATVLRIADAFEKATSFRARRPALSSALVAAQ